MFGTFDRYAELKVLVHEVLGSKSREQKIEYLIQERAVADFIFTYYEQLLYQWSETGDAERRFVFEILQYVRMRLLPNPRLVYWWLENGGGLETSYEERTRNDWNKYVGASKGIKGWCDAAGPFDISVRVVDRDPKLTRCLN